jgi:carbamoyltransferase
VILNTSFNDNGEPIVETPKDAIKSLLNMDIDYLVIGNYIVSKSENKKFNQKSFSYE